jgi:hypothetical protein
MAPMSKVTTFEEWVASLGEDYFAGADPEFVAKEAWMAAVSATENRDAAHEKKESTQ